MIATEPDGEHMSMETYRQVIKFTKKHDFPLILLSGGEPTLHPDLMQMIAFNKKQKIKTFLLSNGTFLKNGQLKQRLLKSGIEIQVTNDEKYYPVKVPIISHPRVSYEDTLRVINPCEKTRENNIPVTEKGPTCFNVRSISRHCTMLKQVIIQLRSMTNACTPSINIDGTLVAGEADSCAPIGTVWDGGASILNRLQNLQCTECGLINNLSDIHRDAIL
jgi:hypothetical protein